MPIESPQWKVQARLELAGHGVDKELADAKLSEVEQHCADSDQQPHEAFGTPEDFAATVVAERGPVHNEDYLSTAIMHVGRMAVILGAVLWFSNGLMLRMSTADLVGTILLMCLLCGVSAIRFLAMTGKPRAVPWTFAGIGVLIPLTAMAFGLLPEQELFTLPAPLLVALGLALSGWGFYRDRPGRQQRTGHDTEQWLRDLAGVLEGRHDIPRERAGELASEAAAHLAATGLTALEEFGQVDDYAWRLAQHETPRPPWWRRERTLNRATPLFLVMALAINLIDRGPWWLTGILVLGLIIDLWTRVSKRVHPETPAGH